MFVAVHVGKSFETATNGVLWATILPAITLLSVLYHQVCCCRFCYTVGSYREL